jgi:hypothetical protein
VVALLNASHGDSMTVINWRASREHLRSDDVFFFCMAVVAAIAILVGFAHTYFLAGMMLAPLPSLLVHVHAVVFLTWIVLFATQISLIATRNVNLHQRVGAFGFALAAIMIPLGLLAASARLARQLAHPDQTSLADVLDLYAAPIFDMLMFSVFTYFAFRNRSRPTVHKRLILFATFSLLDAGFDRWSVFDPYPLWQVNLICFVPLVLATMVYDRWSTGIIQRVTIWSAAFLLTTQEIRHFISQTESWAHFAHGVAARVPPFL